MNKGKVRPRTAMKAETGSGCIPLLCLNRGARWGWAVNATPRPLYPRERYPVPIVWEAGWASGPVWAGAENFASPGFDPQTVASHYADYAVPAAISKL